MENPDFRSGGGGRRRVSAKEKKSCCTWPKIVVTIVALVVLGIIIWQFAPVDNALNKVLPEFNTTDPTDETTDNDDEPVETGTTTPAPSPSPSEIEEEFTFIQCEQFDDCCNGLDTICDLGVDDILYASVHNAMATFEDGFLFGPNHRYQLEKALDAGYRGLNVDLCNCGGQFQFCHGVCNLGARDPVEVFTAINKFLDDNPTEILLITIEVNSKVSLPVDLFAFYELIDTVNGLTDKIYVHDDLLTDWPTLREAKRSNKRLLMFHYNGPDCVEDACPSGLHQWFSYAVETEFDFDSIDEIIETKLSCNITRGWGVAADTFFAVNNFVTPPSQSTSEVLNSLDFARERIDDCSALYGGFDVNLVFADFWSVGQLPRLAQEHNTAIAEFRRQRSFV